MAAGQSPQHNTDDVVQQLRELVDLTRALTDAQRATQHILQNPDLKQGGPYTRAGRWWERQKTYKDMFQSNVKSGKKWGQRIGRAVGRAAGRVTGAVTGKEGKAGAAAGGQMGGGVGKAAGAVAGAAATVAVALHEAYKAIGQWTESLMESNKKLAEVSGSMAAVMADREIKEMMRDLHKGEATAETASDLVQAEDRRKKAEDSVTIPLTNLGNKALTFLNDLAADILEPIGAAVEWFQDNWPWGEKKKEDKDKWGGVAGMARDMAGRMDALEKENQKLMDKARAAGSGYAGPSGALPGGRIGSP